MSYARWHMERHHNPPGHIAAAAAAALGALVFAVLGHYVPAALVMLLVALNVVHAVNEHRHPIYRLSDAEHLENLRAQIAQELGPDSDED